MDDKTWNNEIVSPLVVLLDLRALQAVIQPDLTKICKFFLIM